MLDTRAETARKLGTLKRTPFTASVKFLASLSAALLLTYVPLYPDLDPAPQRALFILLFAAGLWISEAIPAFAVGLLVIGLEIWLLGDPGGPFAEGPKDWEMFIRPWGSPIIWLFFAGFVMAAGMTKTGLDRWLAARTLGRFGTRPSMVLLGVMGITFVFSMFISNTAATATMIALLGPLLVTIPDDNRFGKALLVGLPFAANLGGMGTLIGSPPNAIAAGALSETQPVHFADWLMIGLPPATLLAILAWLYLLWRYPSSQKQLDISALRESPAADATGPAWQRTLVAAVFALTVLLWMTSSLHGVPVTVISFLPIVAFTTGRVLKNEDIRSLRWEVLLLMAGGLSLGVAVYRTGLADWIVAHMPIDTLGRTGLVFLMAYVTCLLSNFMSNTGAANVLVPLGMALGAGSSELVLPIALSASCAMCLPVSTPPNAIAYAYGRVQTRDFLEAGLLIGIAGPGICSAWCQL